MNHRIDAHQPQKIQRFLNTEVLSILVTDLEKEEQLGRFIQECCIPASSNPLKHSTFHRAYRQWSLRESIDPISIPQIRCMMSNMGVETGNRNGSRTYKGIRLKSEVTAPLLEPML